MDMIQVKPHQELRDKVRVQKYRLKKELQPQVDQKVE